MGNHKLKILTYISQRARSINRNISPDRQRQQTLPDLDQEGSHASVFRGPTQVLDALFLEMTQMQPATCAAQSC